MWQFDRKGSALGRDMLEVLVAYGYAPATGVRPRAATTGPHAAICLTGAAAVGKTTVALGLAAAWSADGQRLLLVDLGAAEELSRILQLGASIEPGLRATLYRSLRDRGPLEPAPTLLGGVDIVAAGTEDGTALAALLAARPTLLADADYDRVIVDAPAHPCALLESARRAAHFTLPIVPCALAASVARPDPATLGLLLSGWSRGVSPDEAWLARAYDTDQPLFLDTVLPCFEGLGDPSDVLCAPARVSDAFVALARELDGRIRERRST